MCVIPTRYELHICTSGYTQHEMFYNEYCESVAVRGAGLEVKTFNFSELYLNCMSTEQEIREKRAL